MTVASVRPTEIKAGLEIFVIFGPHKAFNPNAHLASEVRGETRRVVGRRKYWRRGSRG